MENILIGKLDAQEWDFGKYWPSQAQQVKINKCMADRNEVLDAARSEVMEGRNKLVEKYLADQNQEVDEKKQDQFGEVQEEEQKEQLKLDCFMERADRRQKELDIAVNLNAIYDLRNLHHKCLKSVQSCV